MTTRPRMVPKVASRSSPRAWVSGMISSLMTKSMAPAAKPMAYGKIGCARLTAQAPRTTEGDLHQACPDSRVRRVEAAAVAGLQRGKCHRQPFGNVLQADGPHEGEGLADVARTKPHPHRQPLGQVVQGDGHDEEEDRGSPAAAPLRVLGSGRLFPADGWPVKARGGGGSTGRRDRGPAPRGRVPQHRDHSRQLDPGQDQAGEAGRQHHPGGKPQAGIEETFRGFSHQHDGESPQEVQGGDDDPAHKALPDRVGARDAQEEFLQSRRLTPTACSAPWTRSLTSHILPPNRHSPACPGRRT